MSISLYPFDPRSHLAGPPSLPDGVDDVEFGACTGGRLIAIVERSRGLRSLWRGQESLLRPAPDLSTGGTPLRGDGLRFGPGSWERRIPLPSGAFLVERGLVPDIGGALVVQWHWIPPLQPPEGDAAPDCIELRLGSGEGLREDTGMVLSLTPGSPAILLIASADVSLAGATQLLDPLRARELQRSNRSRLTDLSSFRILVDGVMDRAATEALQALDESPLSRDGGNANSLFLGGVEEGVPHFLEGALLAEVGVAALLTGRRSLARSALQALAEEAVPPPIPLLHFSGQWAHWTGDPWVLTSFRESLDRAVVSLGPNPSPASLPQPSRVLREVIEGIEPLGDEGWNQFLRDHLTRIEAPESHGRRRALPVFGAVTSGKNSDDHAVEVSGNSSTELELPAPPSFASPSHPGVAARRTVQGARILRAWIEGVLGARPDAGYGRIRMAPAIRSNWESLEATGVRVGDSLFSIHFRKEEAGCEFILRQLGGKVPANLIFEPLLPYEGVIAVWIDGDPAEVEIKREAAGIRLRCQLPLDGERRIRIEGTTSAIFS